MGLLRLIGNILWFVLGGFFMGIAWWLVGVIAFISIVGIPWGRACFVIGSFTFWPFGREAVSRRQLSGREDIGTGPLGMVGNIIWLIVFGWWLALGHLGSAIADFVTIIGIPFGIQHLKLALISLWPIGVQIIPSDAVVIGRAAGGIR
ncbi:MAG TPA: YccF domain-containing protein [Gammaproteobacteria bacterium]|nr:YccF domain-containing protein [Gammaproteobacteria bacterium]